MVQNNRHNPITIDAFAIPRGKSFNTKEILTELWKKFNKADLPDNDPLVATGIQVDNEISHIHSLLRDTGATEIAQNNNFIEGNLNKLEPKTKTDVTRERETHNVSGLSGQYSDIQATAAKLLGDQERYTKEYRELVERKAKMVFELLNEHMKHRRPKSAIAAILTPYLNEAKVLSSRIDDLRDQQRQLIRRQEQFINTTVTIGHQIGVSLPSKIEHRR